MKYVIDIPDNTGWIEYYAPVEEGSNHFKGTAIGVDQMTPYIKSGRKSIEDDVWEFAMFCLKMDGADFYNVFGSSMVDCLTKYSYDEARSRYEAWKNREVKK